MLTQLKAEDFKVLRGPLESNRQSPNSIAGALILGILAQWLFYFLEQFIGQYSIYPLTKQLLNFHFWSAVILTFSGVIFSIPAVFKKAERIQYLLSIIVIHYIASFSTLFLVLLLLGTADSGLKNDVMTIADFGYVILSLGLLVLIASTIRYVVLLKKGFYKSGTESDITRKKLETASYLPAAIIGGIGVVYLLQFLIRNGLLADIETSVVVIIFSLIFLTMMYILPEQLIILHCKYRFKSFNFNERGYLYSETASNNIKS